MSVARKIAQNTVIQLIGKVVSTVLGLVAIGLLTRYLGVEQFGWYTTAITFLQFGGILIDFGLIPVTAQMLGAGKYNTTELFKNLLAYRFVTAAVFFGLTPLIAWLFPYPTEVKWAITLLSVSFLAISMNQVLTGYYQKELAMQVPVLGEIVGRIILVAGLVIGQWNSASFLTIMVIVASGSLAYTAVMWIAAARKISAGFAFNPKIWKAITITMWPVAISVIFNVVYLKGDTILLSLYRTQVEVGFYGAAYRVVDILAQMAMLMMGVMLPLLSSSFAQKKFTEFKEFYQNSFDSLMLLAVPMFISTWVLADKIMVFVAGPEFVSSGTMLRLLAVAIFGVYLGAVFGHTAVAIGQQKATMWIYISDAIITFAGYMYAIPRYGWMGAAAFTIFSELYAGILLAWVVSKHTPTSLSLARFGKIILAGAIMGGVLCFTIDLPIIALVIEGAILYIVAILGLRIYSWEGIKQITSGRK